MATDLADTALATLPTRLVDLSFKLHQVAAGADAHPEQKHDPGERMSREPRLKKAASRTEKAQWASWVEVPARVKTSTIGAEAITGLPKVSSVRQG